MGSWLISRAGVPKGDPTVTMATSMTSRGLSSSGCLEVACGLTEADLEVRFSVPAQVRREPLKVNISAVCGGSSQPGVARSDAEPHAFTTEIDVT